MKKFFLLLVICTISTSTNETYYNIGVIIVATGKYINFIPRLLEAGKKYFLSKHNVTFFIMTNEPYAPEKNVILLYQPHMAWPYSTMLRYKAYLEYRKYYEYNDYLFFMDADLVYADEIDETILGETVATLHPAFVNPHYAQINAKKYPHIIFNPEDWVIQKDRYEYECFNEESTAYLESGEYYFYGALFGGKSTVILNIIDSIYKNMKTDFKRGIIARWHDESHLNKYFNTHLPEKILPPLYAYPDVYVGYDQFEAPFSRKITAITKVDSEYRLEDATNYFHSPE